MPILEKFRIMQTRTWCGVRCWDSSLRRWGVISQWVTLMGEAGRRLRQHSALLIRWTEIGDWLRVRMIMVGLYVMPTSSWGVRRVVIAPSARTEGRILRGTCRGTGCVLWIIRCVARCRVPEGETWRPLSIPRHIWGQVIVGGVILVECSSRMFTIALGLRGMMGGPNDACAFTVRVVAQQSLSR